MRFDRRKYDRAPIIALVTISGHEVEFARDHRLGSCTGSRQSRRRGLKLPGAPHFLTRDFGLC